MKVPVVLAVLIGILTVACSSAAPAPAEPTSTMDVYSHVLPTMQQEAMSDMDKLLSA